VVIAFINFVNFFMALIPVRIRSVNICKVFGAEQRTLRMGFLFEAIGLVVVSLVLALGIIIALQGSFITEYVTSSLALEDNIAVLLIILALMVLLAVISAIYPALHITRFNASMAVKEGYAHSSSGRRMRSFLAGFQFSIAMILIIVTASFWSQYRYMVNYDIGLDRENVMTFVSFDIWDKGEAVVEKLHQYPDAVDVTACASPITLQHSIWGRRYDGKDYNLNVWTVRYNLPKFFGIRLMDGAEFTEQSHSRKEMIVTANLHNEIGIPLGHEESGYTICGMVKDVKLAPAASFKCKVLQIKSLNQSDGTIGYGRHGKISPEGTVIATIPVGYADGVDRHLSRGNASFLLNGSRVPTIGNICMDMSMLDITGVEAKVGDTVTIFGENPSISELAAILGTIPYEILTSVPRRIKRIIVK
jgi:hypothetical protein